MSIRCNVVAEGGHATISKLKTIKETTSLQNRESECTGSIASMVAASGMGNYTYETSKHEETSGLIQSLHRLQPTYFLKF